MGQFEEEHRRLGVGPKRPTQESEGKEDSHTHTSLRPAAAIRAHSDFTPLALRFQNVSPDALQKIFARYLPTCTREILPYLCEELSFSAHAPRYLDLGLLETYTRSAAAFALQEKTQYRPADLARAATVPSYTSTFRMRSLDPDQALRPILSLSFDGRLSLEVEYPRDTPKTWSLVDDLCRVLCRSEITSAFERATLVSPRDSRQLEVCIDDSLTIRAHSNQPTHEKGPGAWRLTEICILDAHPQTTSEALQILAPEGRKRLCQSGLLPAAFRFIEQLTPIEEGEALRKPAVSDAAQRTEGFTVTTNRKILIRQRNQGVYPELEDDTSLPHPLVRTNVVASSISPSDEFRSIIVQPGGLPSPEGHHLLTFGRKERVGTTCHTLIPSDLRSGAADQSVRIVLNRAGNVENPAPTTDWEKLRALTTSFNLPLLPTHAEQIDALNRHTFLDYPRTVRFIIPTRGFGNRIGFIMER